MKTFILIAGQSGIGKSTLAEALILYWWHSKGIEAHSFEADDWMLGNNGEYKFDAKKLHYCHKACLDACEEMMKNDAPVVIQSNTNIYKKHRQPYYDLARKYGYKIQEIIVRGDGFENQHGVPAEKVAEMKANLEL